MYDANSPYVYRILRRRILGVFNYALVPIFVIFCTKWIEHPSLSDLNISFQWNKEVAMYTFAGLAIVLIFSLLSSPRQSNLEQFPEVRIRFWRPNILIMSALSWIAYIAAYEFFYRGLLFQILRMALDNDVLAIVGCTALYCLSHYFKLNRITVGSIIYGAVSCYVVLITDSLLPAMISHTAMSLFVEWLSIKHHREMFVLRT